MVEIKMILPCKRPHIALICSHLGDIKKSFSCLLLERQDKLEILTPGLNRFSSDLTKPVTVRSQYNHTLNKTCIYEEIFLYERRGSKIYNCLF